jgi:Histone acetylation protein
MTVSASLATFLSSYVSQNLKTPTALSLSFLILSSPSKLFLTIIESNHFKFGIEILKDTENNVLYIQKVDSSLRIQGLAMTIIRGLMAFFQSTWYIYVATGDTYLFPGSTRVPRNDRSLIKWWMTVLDQTKLKKFVWIPGETLNTTKSLFPSDTWKWGLCVDGKDRADTLPQYEDDLVTKAMTYADGNASVNDVMAIMECMELHAGLRALVWLRDEIKKSSKDFDKQFEGLKRVDDMDSVLTYLTSLDFGNESKSEKSTEAFLEHLGLKLDGLPVCKVEPTIAGDSVTESKSGSETKVVNNVSSLIKKKSVVNTISSSLVKKKATTTINPGLIKKKPKLS